MKIVFLAPFGIRPKGTVVARMLPLAVELQRLGREVVIVAPPYTNPEDSGKTEILRGVRLVNVRLPVGGKALGAPLLAWRLLKASLAERPDIVHLFKPKGYGGLAAMLMLWFGRVGIRMPRFFLDTDDWEGRGGMNDLHQYSTAEKRLYAFQEQWLPRRAVGVTVASRMLEGAIRDMGVEARRLLYLPNGVEDSALGDGAKARQRWGIPPEVPVLLLYTRFFEFSQEKLHRVFAEVHRRVPQARLLVVGKGRQNEEEELELAARREGFAEALILAGWVEVADLPDYLAAGDVAIYPFADTLLNRAKCPAKLTELLRSRVPVVADAVGQIEEYIESGATGLLCPPDDWQDMVDKTVEMLENSQLRRQFGVAGRQRLLDRFNWQNLAGALDSFYRELTGNANPGS
ncbi:glycosyl transferase [Geomonas limicola]|uniref:Glycosyl transferase n=1 Tax=Geomonas limicola TaxID=2740186 RepID=A0A6V8NEE3_9BACT|nr:glycosyltransferase family 4 protein [Geomonas limicola]GFO70147.1 glycosyl transferase [Geomonas limicola]